MFPCLTADLIGTIPAVTSAHVPTGPIADGVRLPRRKTRGQPAASKVA